MIADIFIKRPVTAVVTSIVILAVGLISLINLPVAQYPDIVPPQVSISGIFTGADAQTVEQTTTTAIETQVNGSPGMSYIQSTSTSDGRSNINVTFDIGTDINTATLDVQNRVSVAEPSLPEGVKRLGLTTRKRMANIMMVVALYSPNGTHDASFLGNYSNMYLKDALLRVKGVGDIQSFGDDFGMRVWLDPGKLASLNMTVNDVLSALQEQNLQVAMGAIGGSPQPSTQSFEYTVFTNSRLNKKEEFDQIVVRANAESGAITYLKDVARVELGKFNYDNHAYVNGKTAAFMLVFQAPGANALTTYDGILETMNTMKKTFPKDVDYLVPYETVSVVSASIKEVMYTLIEALILVVLVVFLFLQNWRATLIPVLAIPVSLIGAFIFFIPLGFSINTLTLFGMILAIGIVVDDAIVVVEAVQHNMDVEGLAPKEATIKAMKSISGPVIAIALILAAVFVPVGFIPGIVGRLYQQFAITIAISVLISAFVALSLTPALCTILLKNHVPGQKQNFLDRFFARFNNWFGKVTNSYGSGVAKWIKGTPYVLVMMVCLFVGLAFLFKSKATGFIPNEDQGYMFVAYELPEGTSINRNIEVLHKMVDTLSSVADIRYTGSVAGFNAVTNANKSNAGTIFVLLQPWEERKGRDVNAILEKVQAKLNTIKEANIYAIAPPAIDGIGSTGGFTIEIQKRESADGVKAFEKAGNDFLQALYKRPEIGRAFSFFNARTPGYRIDVDRDKVKKLGVSLADVYGTMSTLLGSAYINDINLYGRNFRVMAQADSTYRGDLAALNKYYVRNSMGNMIPLSSLITTTVIEQPAMLAHYNIFQAIEINGEPAPGYSSGQAIEALKEVAAQTLPAGYGYEFSGLSREEIKAGNSSLYIFLMSFAFVFLFLAALYESWAVPFSVLFAVPIGAFGSILTLTFLPALSNNVYAQIGLITLIGLSAKNAILIVEYAKERVDTGWDILEATLEAIKLRLRPIVMTSLAFIFGVLPLAFATGAGAEARKTIGWTVFGGMLTSTTLAIFVVPVLFVLIMKIAHRNRKVA